MYFAKTFFDLKTAVFITFKKNLVSEEIKLAVI